MPVSEEYAEWGSEIRLRVRAYLSPSLPPLRYVTSARAVVLKGEHVLLQTDVSTSHILPGGRIEPGETPERAVRREVLEETGWELGQLVPLGFIHLHHLTPRRPDYAFPYPDFLQVVYAAHARESRPEAILRDGYERSSELVPASEVSGMRLTARESAFLRAALALRQRSQCLASQSAHGRKEAN